MLSHARIKELNRQAHNNDWDIDTFQKAISDPNVRAPRDISGLVIGGVLGLLAIAAILASAFGIH